MSLLSRYISEKQFDIRMVARGLSKGLILQEEVEKNQKKLADDSENANYSDIGTLMEASSSNGILRNGAHHA